METIYFYAPDHKTHYLFEQKHLEWSQIVEARKFCSGNFTSWIVTTYVLLKQAGLPCEITDKLPTQGIVIADRCTLGNKYPYLHQTMLICAKCDQEFHSSAFLHIIHNETELAQKGNKIWQPYYLPHWPQPNLIPRSQVRGSLLENVAFIGNPSNLSPEFSADKWNQALKNLGCKWLKLLNCNQWNDYSQIDLTIAVRNFNKVDWFNKPASKLVNAWLAGVPAVFGVESAFRSLKKTPLDFFEINSIEEAIIIIKILKENPQLYLAMIDNGLKRSLDFTQEKITEQWIIFFKEYVYPQYEQWQKLSHLQKLWLYLQRYLLLKLDRIKKRLVNYYKLENKFLNSTHKNYLGTIKKPWLIFFNYFNYPK